MPDWFEPLAWIRATDFSDWLAAVSLLVSLGILVRQRGASGRAHFTAEWSDSRTVTCRNHGPGSATDVHSELEGVAVSLAEPIPYVGALQRVGFMYLRGAGNQIGALTISWNDNRRKRQTLKVYLPDPPQPEPFRSASSSGGVDQSVREAARDEANRAIDEFSRRLGGGY